MIDYNLQRIKFILNTTYIKPNTFELTVAKIVNTKIFMALRYVFRLCLTLLEKGGDTRYRLQPIVSNLKLKQAWKHASEFIFLFGIISLNAYPISRAAGAMYQSARGNAIVKVN